MTNPQTETVEGRALDCGCGFDRPDDVCLHHDRIAAERERAAIVKWLREDAGKTADDLRRLHQLQKLTPSQTVEWEILIGLKAGLATAIESAQHLNGEG